MILSIFAAHRARVPLTDVRGSADSVPRVAKPSKQSFT
jgi:hypothetical protein